MRQSLVRKSALVPKTLQYFGKPADPNTYIYDRCGDERTIICPNDPFGDITREAIAQDRLLGALRWLGSFIVSQPHRYTTVWLPATTEPADVWLPPEPTPTPDIVANLIQIRGVSAGTVAHMAIVLRLYRRL
jgi:hypothetical protein